MLTAVTCAPGTTRLPLSVTVPTRAVCDASCADALVARSSPRPRNDVIRPSILPLLVRPRRNAAATGDSCLFLQLLTQPARDDLLLSRPHHPDTNHERLPLRSDRDGRLTVLHGADDGGGLHRPDTRVP